MSDSINKLKDLEKTGNFVFHGSGERLSSLEPRQAYTLIKEERVKDGEPAVFATPIIDIAIFMAIINDSNMKKYRSGFSCSGNIPTFRATKETLDQLNKNTKGYVYIFNKELFSKRNEAEYISINKVTPIDVIQVNGEDLPKPISIIY